MALSIRQSRNSGRIDRRLLTIAALVTTLCAGAHAESVTGVSESGRKMRVTLSSGNVAEFTACNDYMVRVEYRINDQNSAVSEVMDPALEPTVSFKSTSTGGDPIVLTGEQFTVTITKNPDFTITFKNSAGTTLFASGTIGQNQLAGTVVAGNYYGGRTTRYYSQNNNSYTFNGSKPIFNSTNDQLFQGMAASPFLWTPKKLGVIVDAEDGTMNLNGTAMSFNRNGAVCQNKNNLFFLIAGSPRQIMQSYYLATGRHPVPPRWTCGFFNSQWGFPNIDMQGIVEGYRQRDIPLDAFILDYDWFFYNNQNGVQDGDFKWNTNAFPTAQSGELKRWMDERGVKMVGIRKPHGAFAGGQWGTCADFYDSGIRTMFWDKFVNPAWDCYARGIIAYWNDEADACNNGDKPFMFLYMQKSLYDGQRSHASYGNNRVWSINRSYIGGAQRYAYGLWSGDIQNSNQEMQDQRGYMLSAINCGAAWWSMDIGGFHTRPSDDDYLHWMQFGAFVPIYRVHGNLNQERYPWDYGPDAERVSKMYIQLRYSLIPYIYSGYWKLHRDGLPLVRPLIMDYPDDGSVTNNASAWMFGEQMYVSPVVGSYNSLNRSVWVPAGRWVNFWTDADVDGGKQNTIAITADQIPLLVKAGAVIPRQPHGRWVDDPDVKDIAFHVYCGADGEFEYFDDDGLTYDYEKGGYCSIRYSHQSGSDMEVLTVGSRTGSYTPAQKSGQVVFRKVGWEPKNVRIQSRVITGSKVDKAAFAAATAPAWCYDSDAKTVSIKLEDPFAAGVVHIARSATATIGRSSQHLLAQASIAMKGGRTLHVSLPPALAFGNAVTLQVIAANGALVKSLRIDGSASELSFDTATWPNGVCMVKLVSGTTTVVRRITVVR